MALLERLASRSRLVSRMARLRNVDLVEKLERDPNATYQYHEAVMRCAQCAETGRCESWLSKHDKAPLTPHYCANRIMLDELASQRKRH